MPTQRAVKKPSQPRDDGDLAALAVEDAAVEVVLAVADELALAAGQTGRRNSTGSGWPSHPSWGNRGSSCSTKTADPSRLEPSTKPVPTSLTVDGWSYLITGTVVVGLDVDVVARGVVAATRASPTTAITSVIASDATPCRSSAWAHDCPRPSEGQAGRGRGERCVGARSPYVRSGFSFTTSPDHGQKYPTVPIQ